MTAATLPVLLRYQWRGASLKIGWITMDNTNDDGEWIEGSISIWAVFALLFFAALILFACGGIAAIVLGG